MMIYLSVLFILQLAVISHGTPYCPMNKKVGDTCYTRVDTTVDFKKFDCYQDCAYKKAGSGGRMEDGQLYCFKAGPLPVSECASGYVRIDSNKRGPYGTVTFENSPDCLTYGPQNYRIGNVYHDAFVPYNGTCNVQEIGAIITGTPIQSCTYKPPQHSDEKEFKIEVADTFPYPCKIYHAGTSSGPYSIVGITVVNNSTVPVSGAIIGRDRNGQITRIPYGIQNLIQPDQRQFVPTPFGFPTSFVAFNDNIDKACNIRFQPSIQYTIEYLSYTPFCSVYNG